MRKERGRLRQDRFRVPQPAEFDEAEEKNEDVLDSAGFDLVSFFNGESSAENAEQKNHESVSGSEPLSTLLSSLKKDAEESITTLSSQVTAENFSYGAGMTAQVFSALGSLVGMCGAFCGHSLSSLSQMGAGFSGMTPHLHGLHLPEFSHEGEMGKELESQLDSLSRFTGVTKQDLRSGKFSSRDIIAQLMSVFSDGMNVVFGFGLVESIVDCFFDCLIPQQGSEQKQKIA